MRFRPSIIFNGHNSADDFDLIITDIKHYPPEKQLVRASIPFSNHPPDFSRITGKYTYNRRKIEYTFLVSAATAEELEAKIDEVNNWLYEAPPQALFENTLPNWYFDEASCDNIEPEYISALSATLKATFTAYPFKRSVYSRPQSYSATSTLTEQNYLLTLDSCTPVFTTNTACQVLWNNEYYTIPANSVRHRITDICFSRGSNTFSISGSGQLIIECIKEAI